MNKRDLIGEIASSTGMPRADAALAVEAILSSITSALARGDEVRISGFGIFFAARRKASVGRNPRTGEPSDIPAMTQPRFKAGRVLRAAVKGTGREKP